MSEDIFKKITDSITDEQREKFWKDWEENRWDKDLKTGWISIEDCLPRMSAMDLLNGGTRCKVKTKDGEEFDTRVGDHQGWYYEVKEIGVTHWWYEDKK
jgi:hypothetical protein